MLSSVRSWASALRIRAEAQLQTSLFLGILDNF